MSEFQYYEFRAIDRPLDERAMADLRSISSRATITPTSLVNVYNYGDFRGDPARLMEQYFDAHVYTANWGTHRLMLRMPARSFSLSSAEPYLVDNALDAWATREHVILRFHSSSDEGSGWLEEDEEAEWLNALIPLRSDLLAGDLRCLYLGWLAGVQAFEVTEEEVEPPVPPGLGQLSTPLQWLADFLWLDPELIEAAAAASGEAPKAPTTEDLAAWAAGLSSQEKDGVLLRLMQGEGSLLASELLQRFRKEHARQQGPGAAGQASAEPRRTVSALLAVRDSLAEEKKRQKAEKAAKERAERAREKAAERGRYLDSLAGRQEQVWEEIEAAINAKQAKKYDHAASLLKDLRDLAEQAGTTADVSGRIRALRERHASKRSLMERLDRAGLPK